MPIKNRIAELHAEITEWRRDIHAHPEIGFDTHRTSALVEKKLREFGCDEIKTGLGKTGVVGVIKGRSDSKGRVVGLRADMDALPMQEQTGLPYASTEDGKMHACGHDGHTAMLLGAAKYLCETRNFDGTAVVIFQPAEEGGGGGEVMCQDGMMDLFDIQEVYGMHTMPGLDLGKFTIRAGAYFAAADQFTIHVEGKGGHAAMPNDTIDTTVVAAQIVIALQTIASRNLKPTDEVVVSVTSFETESKAYNVIPQKVELRGTVRSLSEEVRDMAEERVKAIVEHTAAAFGATAVVDYERGYPVMVNSDQETQYMLDVAKSVAGSDNATDGAEQVMGAEDFAYMLQERPGSYILIGNGDTPHVHHPEYNFDDEAIPLGSSLWAELIETRMPAS